MNLNKVIFLGSSIFGEGVALVTVVSGVVSIIAEKKRKKQLKEEKELRVTTVHDWADKKTTEPIICHFEEPDLNYLDEQIKEDPAEAPEEEKDAEKELHQITDIEFLNDPGFSKVVWRYYVEEGIICTEEDLPVMDPEKKLGDYLDIVAEYAPSSQESLFFRNETTKTDFEIRYILPVSWEKEKKNGEIT